MISKSYAHLIDGKSFTGIYKLLMKDLITVGEIVSPRNMPSYELANTSLVLRNPRNRLLYSNVRKHNYTYGAAELLWYLAGTNRLDFIEFYLPRMRDFSDDGETVNSAYGHRIFGVHADFPNQWQNIINLLIKDPDTRQAIITIHYQKDLVRPSKDVPCTLNLHFMIRHDQLDLYVQMRSNDAYMGLIYDVFSFTLLQEHMFNLLKNTGSFPDLVLGSYVHRSDSMHLYHRDINGAERVMAELFPESMLMSPHELMLDSKQLTFLKVDEKYLRELKQPIPVDNYTGICRFMAEKLNKILKKHGNNSRQ